MNSPLDTLKSDCSVLGHCGHPCWFCRCPFRSLKIYELGGLLEMIHNHSLLESYQKYAIFSALASWIWTASCMVVSLLGQLYVSRSTTTDKLRLLLAVFSLVPQGMACSSEACRLFFPAVFVVGPPRGLVSILPAYFIEGCGWLLGSEKHQIGSPFDGRVCEMDDDTAFVSLCVSRWQDPLCSLLPNIFLVQPRWSAALKDQSTAIRATLAGCVDLLANAATLLSFFSETVWFVAERSPHPAGATKSALWLVGHDAGQIILYSQDLGIKRFCPQSPRSPAARFRNFRSLLPTI
eukprot:scaffold7214_cov75-Cylindrotheca_fusiformis.AAC.1